MNLLRMKLGLIPNERVDILRVKTILEGFSGKGWSPTGTPEDIIEYIKCFNNVQIEEETKCGAFEFDNDFFVFKDIIFNYDSHEMTLPSDILEKIWLLTKHQYAWKYFANILFSKIKICHELVLEIGNDFLCSCYLANGRYYKQAYQIIRNSFEASGLFLYLHTNNSAYEQWENKGDDFYSPEYKEILRVLSEDLNLLSSSERRNLYDFYRRLNHSVHLKRNRLNMNIPRLQRDDNPSTYYKDLEEWINVAIGSMRSLTELFIDKLFG